MAPLLDKILKKVSKGPEIGPTEEESGLLEETVEDESETGLLELEEEPEVSVAEGGRGETEEGPEPSWKGEIRELSERIERLTSSVSMLETENRELRDEVSKFGERMQKLFKVYEIVFRGINPFDEGIKEIDKDLLGEDVFEIFKEFVGGEGVPYKKIEELENKIAELERLVRTGVPVAGKPEEKRMEEEIVEEYMKAFHEGEKVEEGEKIEERPEPKWGVGERALSPEGKVVEILERKWDPTHKQWRYNCKFVEEGS